MFWPHRGTDYTASNQFIKWNNYYYYYICFTTPCFIAVQIKERNNKMFNLDGKMVNSCQLPVNDMKLRGGGGEVGSTKEYRILFLSILVPKAFKASFEYAFTCVPI